MKKVVFIFMISMVALLRSSAQVAINTDGTQPDASSMLEVKSTSKGVLVSRMGTLQRTGILTPADGLLVYDTDTKTFWFYKSGTGWTEITGSGGIFTIPFSGLANNVLPLFSITNNGDGTSVDGVNNSTSSSVAAVQGTISSTTPGGFSAAVRGVNNGTGGLGIGVHGSQAGSGWGVYGTTPDGLGVYGSATGSGVGVYASSTNGTGLSATSSTGTAANISITNNANSSNVIEVATSGSGAGVNVMTSGGGAGVESSTGVGFAVHGTTSSQLSAGLIGDNNGAGEAVVGRTTSGIAGAVVGRNDGAGYGVRGFIATDASGTGIGVYGQVGVSGSTGMAGRFQNTNSANGINTLEVETNGPGDILDRTEGNASYFTVTNSNSVGAAVHGEVNTIFANFGAAGVFGESKGTGGAGGEFYASNAAGNGPALIAVSDGSGNGISANSQDGNGIEATVDGGGNAIYGWAPSFATGQAGKFNNFNNTNASDVVSVDNDGAGHGLRVTSASNSSHAAVQGTTTGANGNGVIAVANNGSAAYAVWGTSTSGEAGHFSGDVVVVGTLSKSAGTFKIDHPQDPENKYLIHSFVESPDMMNVYNGNVTTDASGVATVELPGYFQAENIDFKYQLTVIGQFAQAIISKEVANNQFEINTDKPGVKVSWQVTGVRNDKYAQKHRIVPEVAKAANEKGYYLNPESFGLPESKGIDYGRGKLALASPEKTNPVQAANADPARRKQAFERLFPNGVIKKDGGKQGARPKAVADEKAQSSLASSAGAVKPQHTDRQQAEQNDRLKKALQQQDQVK